MPYSKPIQGRIDPASLLITDEHFEEVPRIYESKFSEIFGKLKVNQRLKCAPGDVNRLTSALREWLKKQGHRAPIVRCKERCQDGQGGVWWMGNSESQKQWTARKQVRNNAEEHVHISCDNAEKPVPAPAPAPKKKSATKKEPHPFNGLPRSESFRALGKAMNAFQSAPKRAKK